tara:strand:+ start:4379 stop:4966 length:588 start_codon:yes stop_codon:yes gene_type:complete
MSRFYTGNSGSSTGPHLDFRVYNPSTGGYEDPSQYTSYLTVGDNKDPFSFGITSGRGMREHPTKGGQKMHEGIDYATPLGTGVNVNGNLLSTWNDEGGGGIMSQYVINTDDGHRELLLMHGNSDNQITGTGAVTDYDTNNLPSPSRSDAKAKAQNYKDMSASQLNAEYDRLRAGKDINAAAAAGLAMHKAHFNKP